MCTATPIVVSDLSAASPQVKEEIKRQSEAYLSAQLQSGIAADQRAMSFVSLMAAASVVVAGGGAALLLGSPPQIFIGWLCICIAVSFVISMGIAIESAAPIDFHFGGGAPEDWIQDIALNVAYEDSMSEFLVNLQNRISANKKMLDRNARWMWWGVRIAWGGLSIGGVIGIVALFMIVKQ